MGALADATGHTAVEEEEGIITRKKAEKGVAIVTRNNQHFREGDGNFRRPSFWRESRNN